MITRGSKFFYAAAVVGFVTAIVYGFLTGAAAHSGVIGVFQDGDVVNSIVGPLTFGWKGWVGDHVGYSVLMGFAAVMAASVYIILDLEFPRVGLIRLDTFDHALVELRASMD